MPPLGHTWAYWCVKTVELYVFWGGGGCSLYLFTYRVTLCVCVCVQCSETERASQKRHSNVGRSNDRIRKSARVPLDIGSLGNGEQRDGFGDRKLFYLLMCSSVHLHVHQSTSAVQRSSLTWLDQTILYYLLSTRWGDGGVLNCRVTAMDTIWEGHAIICGIPRVICIFWGWNIKIKQPERGRLF